MKIFIWGTGFAAGELWEDELSDLKVSGFIDSNPDRKAPDGSDVYTPEQLLDLEYDLVIVATRYAREIHSKAVELGLDTDKFLFVYNNYEYRDINDSYSSAAGVLSSELIDSIKCRCRVIRAMDIDGIQKGILADDPMRCSGMYQEDYVRIRTFELCAGEIIKKQVKGAVAELGVYRGEFARFLNTIFKDRDCYLFDTFEGFGEAEALQEKQDKHCGDTFIEHFKKTSVEIVLDKMPYKDKIRIRKGYFPESLEGLDETFAFVSIDVDFEQSIYEGLVYFYPRLQKGGYIFVHDYNSKKLKGVRSAVDRYEMNYGAINRIPIPDVNGTLIITKQ